MAEGFSNGIAGDRNSVIAHDQHLVFAKHAGKAIAFIIVIGQTTKSQIDGMAIKEARGVLIDWQKGGVPER